ncbi:MAG: metallophosphoesterase [Verrucomicrobiae bacterium]|nr:metallophosphoesterase [Verrucomicrobiae bacterium]
MVHLIHISDTHIGPTRDFEVRGARSLSRLEALVDTINALDFTPDLIIHTGDVANDPDAAAYRLASDCLGKLKAPVYFCTGNHDDGRMMREMLPSAPSVPLIPDQDRLTYRIDLPDFKIYVLDGRIPEEEGPHGRLLDSELAAFRSELSAWDGEYAVFLHFPPLAVGSRWIDRHLLLSNGESLHQAMIEADPARNRGVFFGHLHRGLQIYRDGLLYTAVSSPACQFSVGPDDDTVAFDSRCPIAFNHVTFRPGVTMVKEFTPLPAE